MNNIFIFLLMIFCHIVDDYCLQACWLSYGKQKIWWQENASNKLYKYDYIWALLMHSFSWTFMIMLPIAFVYKFNVSMFFVYIFILNVIVHAITDNEKANKLTINLWADQLIHISQIILTAIFLL